MRRTILLGAAAATLLLAAGEGSALAQPRGPGGRPPPNQPTQSSPTQQRTVGPRGDNPSGDDDPSRPTVTQRGEPTVQLPQDPLAVTPEVREKIGSDWDGAPLSPRRDAPLTRQSSFPYEEARGDYRLRMLPPFWFEHTRGLKDPTAPAGGTIGIPTQPDVQSLYGLLYYQRRSPKLDADVLFPAFWHVRDDRSYTTVVGPLVHREAPGENDNWLAPLYFAGSRPDGGYFHSPALLTTSHWGAKGAFTLVGPYFRDRTGRDVDLGVAPFYFHGDNGNIEGNRKAYTLIPPLLFYHRERELDESQMTVVGPVVMESSPKRDIFDIAPLFFHIHGKPASGGVAEAHTTVLPFFHYGYTPEKSLFVTPVYLRRVTQTADTMITPLFSRATTRRGATELTVAGPIVPLYAHYADHDTGVNAFALAPFYYQSDSPGGHDWLTPLFGRFETYGISTTFWVFPTFQFTTDTEGWAANFHPLLYFGRSGESSHGVVAPIYWDFKSPTSRATVGFPVFWRFSDQQDGTVTQVALNTLYLQRKVPGGNAWSFHVLPIFSYGENPEGYFWNVLFGLVGYERAGSYGRAKAFWIPFQVSGPSAAAPPPAKAAGDGRPGAF